VNVQVDEAGRWAQGELLAASPKFADLRQRLGRLAPVIGVFRTPQQFTGTRFHRHDWDTLGYRHGENRGHCRQALVTVPTGRRLSPRPFLHGLVTFEENIVRTGTGVVKVGPASPPRQG
jgi:hypothetical protein